MKISELASANDDLAPFSGNRYVIIDQVDNGPNYSHQTKKYALSNFVLTNDLSNYATFNDISHFITQNDLSDYITQDDLSNYVTQNDLSNYVTLNYLSNNNYITQIDLRNYVTFDDLSDYVTQNDLSNYITINALSDGQIPMMMGSNEYGGVTSDNIVRRAYALGDRYSQIDNSPLSDYVLLISLPGQNDDYPQLLKVSIAELAQYIQNYSST